MNYELKINKVSLHIDKVIQELEELFTKEYFDINDFYFAGGCIYSIWNDREPKDYDIFCKTKKAIPKLRKWFRQNKGVAEFTTKNAISMGKYQFILKFLGDPKVEVGKSDYKYLDSNKLEFNSDRARDILNIVTRIPKFVERGMEISQKEILDILEKGSKPMKYFKERSGIKKRLSGKTDY